MKTLFFFIVSLSASLTSLTIYAAYPSYEKGVAANSIAREQSPNVELTRRLRAKIMSDKQLSTEAQNINIITEEKSITLKGSVAGRAEKVKLENYARAMAGKKKINNQLTY